MTLENDPTNLEVAKAVFRVLETGDSDLARETVSPDFHNREASVSPSAASLPGPAGLLASSAWMRSAFSDLHFTFTDAISKDGHVWLRLRMSGRHTGAFVQYQQGKLAQAVPPTGRRIDFEQIHVLELVDGRVVSHEAVRDDITMLGQLGVFPPAPATGLRMVAWSVSGKAKRAAAAVSEAASRAASAGS
jgi:predicted ester cyclase